MSMEWSLSLIAIAFAALVVYLIYTLSSARKSLDQVEATLRTVENQLNQLSEEAVPLIRNANRLLDTANQVSADVQGKVHALDPLFDSTRQIGEAVRQVSTSVKQVSATVSQTLNRKVQPAVQQQASTAEQVLKWANVGVELWSRWKSKKEDRRKEPSVNSNSERGEDKHGREQ